MSHPLHEALGQCMKLEFPDAQLILDKACGGDHQLPLFSSAVKSAAAELCDVDMLIVQDKHVRVIIEIEESGINPTQLAGKFLTSALATHYVHDSEPDPVPIARPALFVQVVDTSRLKPGSSKPEQFRNIQSRIQQVLPLRGSAVREYVLLQIDGSDPEIDCQGLIDKVRSALAE